MKREQMSVLLNPAPDFIENEEDLTDYYNVLFQNILRLLMQMENYISQEEEAIPVDYNNHLQFLIICLIKRLVEINKKIQKRTVRRFKKGFAFNEIRYV